MKLPSPVFICSVPRSGTTLIQSLLDGHPQLLVDVSDSRFFKWYRSARYFGRKRRLELARSIMIRHIFNESSHYYRKFLSHISIKRLSNRFEELLATSSYHPKDFLEVYFQALGEVSGHLSNETRHWIDKNLQNEGFVHLIPKWWPKAKTIFVVRDPRDVYTSYSARDRRAGRTITTVESFCALWRRSIRAHHLLTAILGDNSVRTIRYEDLVGEPNATIDKLRLFLDIQDHETLLRPTKGHGRVPWGGNAADGKKRAGIFQGAAGKWKKALSKRQIETIEGLLKDEMVICGYEPSTDGIASLKSATISALWSARLRLGDLH